MEAMKMREMLEKANLAYYLGGSPATILIQMESGPEAGIEYASPKEEAPKHAKCPGCPHKIGLPKFAMVH